MTKDLKVLQKNGLIKNDKTTHLYEITDLGKIEVRKLYLYEKINNMTPDELARFEYLFEHVERIEKLGNKLTKEEMECLERGLAKVDLEDIMTEDEAQELSKALKTVSLSQ
ncbi:MAG: hypothetical protein JRN10_08525 [Nitrososphaerota archaeon]|nr:hypothetical protein [Nitrososphaerota archaeon]